MTSAMILVMQTLIGQDQSDWLNLVWTWMHREIPAGARVFVPAGGTPLPLYRRWVREPTDHLRSLQLMQLDDILTGTKKNEFKHFFERELAPFTAQIEWITSADKSADIAILGVGLNGHVAFHEPGLPRGFYSGCVRLSAETLSNLKLSEPTWGITYGVEALMRAKKILVLACGEAKQSVLQQALQEKKLPIAWILGHANVTLVTDFKI